MLTSTSDKVMSLSLTADHADLTKAFSSFVSAEKIPGESVKTICVLLHVATPPYLRPCCLHFRGDNCNFLAYDAVN